MEVILREDIDKLGARGQMVKVTAGYARNFLLPRKLAVAANESNKKIVEQERQAHLRRDAKEVADASDLGKMMAGVDLLHVPYQGAAPALTDLLAGRANVMFEAMPTLVGYIQSGRLRALGVTTATRSSVFPEVPTIGEFLPGYEASVWFGIAARRQTPGEIVQLLNKEINAGLADQSLNRRLSEFGGTALKGTPAEFEKLFVGDTEKWAKVIKFAGIKAE